MYVCVELKMHVTSMFSYGALRVFYHLWINIVLFIGFFYIIVCVICYMCGCLIITLSRATLYHVCVCICWYLLLLYVYVFKTL